MDPAGIVFVIYGSITIFIFWAIFTAAHSLKRIAQALEKLIETADVSRSSTENAEDGAPEAEKLPKNHKP